MDAALRRGVLSTNKVTVNLSQRSRTANQAINKNNSTIGQLQFNTPVPGVSLWRIRRINRLELAETVGREPIGRNALNHQVLDNGHGACGRQLPV